MKFSEQIEINLPVNKVVELFDKPENLKKWQPGLISFEPLSGIPGEPGAKSKLTYKVGKRKFEMIETITVRELPKEFSGTYEAKGMVSIIKNKFVPAAGDKTIYISEQEFQLKGFMKFIGLFMPDSFVKETRKQMQNFKNFAEKIEL